MKEIVEETIRLVPHLVVVHADTIHGIGNPCEMLKEAVGNVLIYRVGFGQNERNLQHGQAVKGHPCRAVGLIQVPASRQFSTAIEDADVVQSQEPARKHVTSLWILAVYPPAEVQHQSLKGAFEEADVSAAQF